MKMAPQIMI